MRALTSSDMAMIENLTKWSDPCLFYFYSWNNFYVRNERPLKSARLEDRVRARAGLTGDVAQVERALA